MAGVLPPSGFGSARLRLHTLTARECFGRIFSAAYPDPLGYGKAQSRFSDPRRRKPENRFGVLYVGETVAVCFLEAVLRDRKDGVTGAMELDEREWEERLFADVEVASPLRTVDLRGNNLVAMGVPSNWRGAPITVWAGPGPWRFTSTRMSLTASSTRPASTGM